jgi:acyl carrier protein
MSETASTREQLKRLIIEHLNLEGMTPDMIEDDALLFGEGLGLDSVDALELVVALEKTWGIRIEDQESTREAFATVASLAAFVDRTRAGGDQPA